jgi:proteasome lid subunit RPN8/RPN11
MTRAFLPPGGGVYRTRPWPVDDLRGRYLICQEVLSVTRRILLEYGQPDAHGDGHEGLVFWAGREAGPVTIFLQAVAPKTEHGRGFVRVDRAAVGEAARAARGQSLGILAQVHSHPGPDARHSDGDDNLIVMPFPNMLSVVVPHLGEGLFDLGHAVVHQFQDETWVVCRPDSVAAGITVIPAGVDLR